MNLKGILKTLKLNEGTISTILGVVVVLAVGFLVINYFKGLKNNSDQKVTSTSTQNVPGGQHTVAAGETLWSISEKYYDSGYGWKDIAEANKLENPSAIEAGQVLDIPEKPSEGTALAQQPSVENLASVSPAPTATPEPSASPTMSPAPTIEPTPQPATIAAGSEYSVVKGDHLWGIAVRTYGDGYQWVKIWHANKQIKNPDLIYVDQKLQLPQ